MCLRRVLQVTLWGNLGATEGKEMEDVRFSTFLNSLQSHLLFDCLASPPLCAYKSKQEPDVLN